MMVLRSVDPSTGEEVGVYDEASRAEIGERLSLATKAFKAWRTCRPPDRAELLQVLACILEKETDLHARLMAREMGKPVSQGVAEIEKCASVCRFYAENGQGFVAPEEIATSAKRSFVRYDPLGTVLAIMPWNFPFWQVFRFAAPALMGGNVAILKHASNVSGCSLAIEGLFERAGFPQGTFQSILASSDKVEGIVRDDRVHAVTLTGSEDAGARVAAIAGSALKKTVLELGGNDAFIVLADADVDAAARAAATSACINSGQSCLAAKRFIVERDVLDAFTQRLCTAMKRMRVGDPMDEGTEVGPQARLDLMSEVDRQVRASVSGGAGLRLGGARLDRKGFFYPPTVLTGATRGMPAYDDEVFGPVATVIGAASADEAVRICNESRYGLSASLWTADASRDLAMAGELDVGSVFFNGIMRSDPRLPFGGVKRSGYGRELGPHGMREFVNAKAVRVD
jgi:succinate-semialdehyde dehydrogenase/glutarate-semialdehyde dehydrogenase